MKPYLLLLGGLICAGGPSLLASGIDATATFTDTTISPGVFQYDLTLNNTGSTTIGTFWFSWIPGSDFMPVSPTGVVSPTGWGDTITTGGPPDGFAILFTANAAADDLAAGGSLSGFMFDSTLTPAELQIASTESPANPVNTAFSYIGAPLDDPGVKFLVTPAITASTPEPTTTLSTALGFGLILLFSNLLRRRRSTASN
jgi:hypothetical protein